MLPVSLQVVRLDIRLESLAAREEIIGRVERARERRLFVAPPRETDTPAALPRHWLVEENRWTFGVWEKFCREKELILKKFNRMRPSSYCLKF